MLNEIAQRFNLGGFFVQEASDAVDVGKPVDGARLEGDHIVVILNLVETEFGSHWSWQTPDRNHIQVSREAGPGRLEYYLFARRS